MRNTFYIGHIFSFLCVAPSWSFLQFLTPSFLAPNATNNRGESLDPWHRLERKIFLAIFRLATVFSIQIPDDIEKSCCWCCWMNCCTTKRLPCSTHSTRNGEQLWMQQQQIYLETREVTEDLVMKWTAIGNRSKVSATSVLEESTNCLQEQLKVQQRMEVDQRNEGRLILSQVRIHRLQGAFIPNRRNRRNENAKQRSEDGSDNSSKIDRQMVVEWIWWR